MRLLAETLPYMLCIMMAGNLSVRAMLILPELRKVLWRKILMVSIASFCGCSVVALLAWRCALHPTTFLLMVVSAIAGGYIARQYHQPRPVLER